MSMAEDMPAKRRRVHEPLLSNGPAFPSITECWSPFYVHPSTRFVAPLYMVDGRLPEPLRAVHPQLYTPTCCYTCGGMCHPYYGLYRAPFMFCSSACFAVMNS
jgi:hypothetical protein